MNWVFRRFRKVLTVSLLVVFPACAYTLVLKDGRLIKFQTYRATESALLYIDDQGREISIPLSSIDFDRTAQLNAEEKPALVLPGMQAQKIIENNEPQPSLAEVARKTKSTTTPAKRVFTDDDVVHSGQANPLLRRLSTPRPPLTTLRRLRISWPTRRLVNWANWRSVRFNFLGVTNGR